MANSLAPEYVWIQAQKSEISRPHSFRKLKIFSERGSFTTIDSSSWNVWYGICSQFILGTGVDSTAIDDIGGLLWRRTHLDLPRITIGSIFFSSVWAVWLRNQWVVSDHCDDFCNGRVLLFRLLLSAFGFLRSLEWFGWNEPAKLGALIE